MNDRLRGSLVGLLIALSCTIAAYAQDDLHIWRDFAGTLKAGKMNLERISPLPQLGDTFKPMLLGYLDSLRAWASPADWDATPEIIRVNGRIQYIVLLVFVSCRMTHFPAFFCRSSIQRSTYA